jgi:hypothetical protein
MKRKETTPGGCMKNNHVLEGSTERERQSKRHDIRSGVSSEDTKSSGSRVKEDEVISPWLSRDVVTSKDDEAQSSSANMLEDGDGPF